eukprot:603983-Prymnesium_polylepis.2
MRPGRSHPQACAVRTVAAGAAVGPESRPESGQDESESSDGLRSGRAAGGAALSSASGAALSWQKNDASILVSHLSCPRTLWPMADVVADGRCCGRCCRQRRYR